MSSQCKTCNVDLVVGENIWASTYKNGDYQCKGCYNKTPERKKSHIKYGRTYKASKNVYKQIGKISAGVYGIFYDCKLIYIGASKRPYARMINHFSKYVNLNQAKNQSNVCYDLSIGKLERDKLRFKMLEFIDDKQSRLDREAALIQQYKPEYNIEYMYERIQ